MTPAARYQVAIDVLDAAGSGLAVEQALLRWSRGARYAGSGDRAAVRDIVFDVIRARRTCAARGGGETGRALVLGLLRQQGRDPETVFSGIGHAPAPLTPQETAAPDGGPQPDVPDWLLPHLTESLGAGLSAYLEGQRQRAPAFLRVNRLKTDGPTAQARLEADGIETKPHPTVDGCLILPEGERGLTRSSAYRDGLVEPQDAASQALVARLGVQPGQKVLDYCAGGGGKTLALAQYAQHCVDAHDANPARMADLPARADRAGAQVRIVSVPDDVYDLVLCDVPCSGSGSWRRAPEGKWTLTPEYLNYLNALQADILARSQVLVAPGGRLAYATCSVLNAENQAAINAFLARMPGWQQTDAAQWIPDDLGDGFFLAVLRRTAA